jgi:hypothetical protein
MSHHVLENVPVPGTGTKLSPKRAAWRRGARMSHYLENVPVPGTGTKLSRERAA